MRRTGGPADGAYESGIGFLAALTFIAAFAACRERQPDVHITALHPLDDRSAIVIYTDRERHELARVDHTGRVAWSSLIPGEPVTRSPYNGVAIADDIVTVRYAHTLRRKPLDHALAGFSSENGALVWDTILTSYRHSNAEVGFQPKTPRFAIALPLGAGLIAEWADDGTSTWLFAVDTRTGAIVSKQPAPDLGAPSVIGASIIVNEVDQTVILDATGAARPQHVSTWFRGCAVDGDYVTLTRQESR